MSQLSLVPAIRIRHRPIPYAHRDIACRIRHQMLLDHPQDRNFPGDPRLRRQIHRPRDHVRVDRRVPNQPPGHQRQDYVDRLRSLRPDLPRRDGGVADELATVVELGGAAVGVAEADMVGVVSGDGELQGRVEVDGEVGYVQAGVEGGEADGVDGGDGVTGAEDGEGEDEEEEEKEDDDRQGYEQAEAEAVVTAFGVTAFGVGLHRRDLKNGKN